ncbi:MAG: hypothetical protein Kow00109_02480 [Acidobacteriota bacterium]
MEQLTLEPRTAKAAAGDWTGWIPVGILLLGCGSWSYLSRFFIYGEGHQSRPIWLFLGIYWIMWAAFAWSLRKIRRGAEISPAMILAGVLGTRALLLPSGLIQENDVYRYVLDGQAVWHGENPFRWTPLERLNGSAQSPLEAASDEAQVVLSRIGYPSVRTIYPPAAQALFALGASWGGWDWRGQRLVFLVLDLLAAGLLVLLLRRLGLPDAWVIVYAWNPLVLKEITNSCHLDVAVAGLLTALLLLLICPGTGWLGSAVLPGLLVALAGLAKWYPLILAPPLAAWLGRRRGIGAAALFLGVAAFGTLLGWLPWLAVGWSRTMEGLLLFAAHWRMNQGIFDLLEMFGGHGRWLAAALSVGAALVAAYRVWAHGCDVVRAVVLVLAIWFLVLPTPFPWYAVPLVACAAAEPTAAGFVLALSGALPLYYLSFWTEYHGIADHWWAAVRALEHIVLWGGLLAAFRRPTAAAGALGGRGIRRSVLPGGLHPKGSQQQPPPS